MAEEELGEEELGEEESTSCCACAGAEEGVAAGEEAVAEAEAVAGAAVDDGFAAADADSLPDDSFPSCFADPAGG